MEACGAHHALEEVRHQPPQEADELVGTAQVAGHGLLQDVVGQHRARGQSVEARGAGQRA